MMTIFAIVLILYATSSRKVLCEESVLTVLSEHVEEGAFLEETGRPLSSESSLFPALRANDLIDLLEKSQTETIQEQLDDLLGKKMDLETKLREAIDSGFVMNIFGLIKERLRLAKELYDAREKLIKAKLDIIDKKKQVARKIVESEEPVSFDLLMRTLSLIYGDDFAREVSELKRKTMEMFEKPFLRPVITISAPDGLPRNCSVVTTIYQNFRRQNTPVLKNNEFTVVTTVTGFTADRLHLGVDFYAVNHTAGKTESESSGDEEGDLLFLRQVIEDQMSLTRARLQEQLKDLKSFTQKQKENLEDQIPNTPNEIQRLENKLVKKIAKINFEKARKQIKLIQRQLQRQQKFLLEFDEIERDALSKQAHVTKKIHTEQRTILNENLPEEEDGSMGKSEKSAKRKNNDLSAMTTTTFAESEVDEVTEDSAFATPPTSTEHIEETVSVIANDGLATVERDSSERNTVDSIAVIDVERRTTHAQPIMDDFTSVRTPLHVIEGNGFTADGVLSPSSERSQNEPTVPTTVLSIKDSIKSSDGELEEVGQDRTQTPPNETRKTSPEFDNADLKANSTNFTDQIERTGEER